MTTNSASTEDEKLLIEAKERFKRCQDFEGDFRSLFNDDLKFVKADPDNGYQWPDAMRTQRNEDARPCLTINKTRQHALMVINEAKEDKPSVRINAVGGDASYDSAQVFEGIIRHIEHQSNAADAYDTALEFQVWTGIGYWRVVSEYTDNDSFDQDLFIRRIRNPLSVYLDPAIKETDGSDAKFGFIFDDMLRDDFNRKYPAFKDLVGAGNFDQYQDWCTEDSVRVAEYYYVSYESDTLIAMPVPDGVGGEHIATITLSALRKADPELAKVVMADKGVQRRKIEKQKVEWCKIAGDKIIERSEWIGSTIPIVRVVGEECLIDGRLDRKGHVRNLKDPQRMYNYWTSSAVEHVALQGKTPYMADARAIEGYETIWETANTENYSVLPYNSTDDQNNPVMPPSRVAPPTMSSAYLQGMQASAEEMKMVSGQNDPLMGAPSNEISGVAINKRQKQGDRATMHFRDNLSKAIRYTGKILVEAIPRAYDTARVIRILAEDGSDDTVTIDPNQQQPMTEKQTDPNDPESGVSRAFNPSAGKYEVVADSGPAYATKREEAFEAMTALISTNPQFMGVFGDLYMLAADFPLADELAERLKRTIPAQILGEGPSPELQQSMDQIEQLQAQLAAAMQLAADNSKEADARDKKNEIDAYGKITDRLDKLFTHLGKLGALPDILGLEQQTAEVAAQSPLPLDQHEPVMQQPAPLTADPSAALQPQPPKQIM